MFLNFKIQSLIRSFFYLILIGVSIQSWNNLMEESTTFDEEFIDNEAIFPSFTLCPIDNFYSNKSIESFEDVSEEIEIVKTRFKIKYSEYKSFQEEKIVEETYNHTLNSDWYFVPRISEYSPYDTVICLVVSPYRKHKHNWDWKDIVSFYNYVLQLYNDYIFVFHTPLLALYLNWTFCINMVFCTISSRRAITLFLWICGGGGSLDRKWLFCLNYSHETNWYSAYE